ncbi:flagellar biosynthetic protein FliR [Treponema sp.]|uniref:flagellar biosynthetic protein FliR n=1 Tax=Treponema sp. TaxID=166 RepID=UPI0025F0198A|nr:flagellar biosynthetic protein FliR [Treponema sp.]MCR5217241.1 flagellar biosynthetic protein FliR [Treponema sp.]
MPSGLLNAAPLYFLVFARCFAILVTLPLFSSRSIPGVAKAALVLFMAAFITPSLSLDTGNFADYGAFISKDGHFNLIYVLLLAGEALIGIIMGFYIQIIFASFSTAGQFFAFQMGFSASEVFDSLSQVENPLMGQFLNMVAMLVFLQNRWFMKLVTGGLMASFESVNAMDIAAHTQNLAHFMASSLTLLFKDSLVIALPVMGTLFLINVTMGILSKAAPQMNLLSEGFPIMMLTSFFIIAILLPYLCDFFTDSFYHGMRELEKLLKLLTGASS